MASRPRIGINAEYRREERPKSLLSSAYYDAVAAAGGVPLILPPLEEPESIEALLDAVDGIVLTGGRDYDPAHFGAASDGKVRPIHPRRQSFDLDLARQVLSRKIPCLGICAGAQLLVIVSGGDLELDIGQARPAAILHEERAGRPVCHDVEILPGSRLEMVLGRNRIQVNSMHHQAIGNPGRGLRISAKSADGVAEAVEGEGPFLLGVQWHPELLPDSEAHRRLFVALVTASKGG